MRIIPYILIVIVIIGCAGEYESQSNIVFDTSLDTTAGRVGDIFHYTISIGGLTNQSLSLPTLIIPEGEVRSVSLLEEENSISGAEFQIVYWDTGQQIIPSFTIDIINSDSSVDMSFKSDPMFITIYSVVTPTDQPGLKPIKPPVPVEKPIPWRIILLSTIILLLIGGILYLWRKRIHQIQFSENPIDFIEPDSWALKRLNELKKSDLTDIKNSYTILSHILREYIERCLYVRTLEMTTEEIIVYKNLFQFSENMFEEWILLLKRSDLTKYAKHIPDLATMHRDFDWANQFIHDIIPMWKFESEANQVDA